MFTARSALTLLGESPNGWTERQIIERGFRAELIAKLVEAGFAISESAGKVKLIRITDLGRAALRQS
jgi:hypothetical protein